MVRGQGVVIPGGGGVSAGRRAAGRGDGVGACAWVVAAAGGVAARLDLLPRCLRLLALQLQLHLELLQLRGRWRRRVDLATGGAAHAGQLRQQLCGRKATLASVAIDPELPRLSATVHRRQ